MKLRNFLNYSPQLGDKVFIDPTATVIGKVTIGDDSSIWPMAVIRGDVHEITVGERTSVQDGSILHVTHAGKFNPAGFPLIIGNDVTIGHRVTLHGCEIQDHCLIGMSSTVMDGAIIESQVILGAGSLVTPGKILDSNYLWMGSPVKKIRPLTVEEIQFIKYSAEYYVGLKNKYLVF